MITLVDTSVWSLALRRRASAISVAETVMVETWRDLVANQKAALIGIIRQEVLSGIKEARVVEKLQQQLNDMPYLAVGLSEHDLAAEFYNTCRTKGIAASAIDMLICAAACHAKAPILTVDIDFIRYQRVLPISLAAVSK